MIRRPPRSTLDRSSAASDVYKRQMHHGADDEMSNQQGIQHVNDADRLQRAERTRQQALMGIDLIQRDFNLPAFMVETYQVEGWIQVRVEQGGQQAMTLGMTGPGWVIDFVLNAADQQVLAVLTSLVITGIDIA